MKISIPEDSGNIQVIRADKPNDIRLKIRSDEGTEFNQWFNFVLEGNEDEAFTLIIEDAHKVSYPGWNEEKPYRAMGCSDEETWTRLDTVYDEQAHTLTIRGALTHEPMQIAFFPPYPYQKHQELIRKATEEFSQCAVSVIGQSVQNRDITLLTFGTPGDDKKNVWIIARQHPGETMAEWYIDGLVNYLNSGQDFSELFDQAVLYIVPNMNPDGTFLGNLRTNANGVDLNRQWDNFDNAALAPEVYCVRDAILKTGVAAFFDIHGDETNPYVFPDGRGIGCSSNQEIEALESEFLNAYIEVSPYLERTSKYTASLPGQENLNMARAFFAEQLNCLSFIFEMPNKELMSGDDWTHTDCKRFGANLVYPLLKILPKLSNKKLSDNRKSSLSVSSSNSSNIPEVQITRTRVFNFEKSPEHGNTNEENEQNKSQEGPLPKKGKVAPSLFAASPKEGDKTNARSAQTVEVTETGCRCNLL